MRCACPNGLSVRESPSTLPAVGLDLKHSVTIDKPSEEVFDFVADFTNNPSWQGGMVACEWTSESSLTVGSTYKQQAKFMGRRIDTHFKVTGYEPGESISIESTVSTFPIQVTRSVEPIDDKTSRVTAHIRGQPTGLLKLFSGMVAKSVKKDYDALKRLLEQEILERGSP